MWKDKIELNYSHSHIPTKYASSEMLTLFIYFSWIYIPQKIFRSNCREKREPPDLHYNNFNTSLTFGQNIIHKISL